MDIRMTYDNISQAGDFVVTKEIWRPIAIWKRRF